MRQRCSVSLLSTPTTSSSATSFHAVWLPHSASLAMSSCSTCAPFWSRASLHVSERRPSDMYSVRLRRVATITGPRSMVPGVDRLEGYLAALRHRGLTPDPELIVEGDFTDGGGTAAMQRLLPLRPEAVFAASDMMAEGALRALREAGRRVPEDIAVVGFDDMPFAARTTPPLTTVRQPVHRMGVVVAETLIDMIENPDAAPRRVILPTEIVIRESCGSSRPAAQRAG